MQAGLLTEKVKILRRVKTESGFGGFSDTWEPERETRANVVNLTGAAGVSAREEFLSGVLSFEFHMWQKVSRDHRIEYGGERYRIEDVDLNKRKRKLIVKASRINE